LRRNEDIATVQILLAKTDGFESRSSTRDPILFQLIARCELSNFARVIEMGADSNVVNNKGIPILSQVVLMNYPDCNLSEFARVLIDAGADFDFVNERNESLLLLSLERGHLEIARLLVKAGASVLGDVHGKDFIMLTARYGMNDLIDIALDNNFDVNRWSMGMSRSSPLYEAARAGHVDTVRYLISKKAELPGDSTNIQNLFRFAANHPEVPRQICSSVVLLNFWSFSNSRTPSAHSSSVFSLSPRHPLS